jgi:hypothetical protein
MGPWTILTLTLHFGNFPHLGAFTHCDKGPGTSWSYVLGMLHSWAIEFWFVKYFRIKELPVLKKIQNQTVQITLCPCPRVLTRSLIQKGAQNCAMLLALNFHNETSPRLLRLGFSL